LEGFRARVLELEKEAKRKDERMNQLEAKVVEMSAEVADKEYEIEFYANSIEELQKEVMIYKAGGGGGATTKTAAAETTANNENGGEVEAWKKKCKVL
jgi:hypothetical protein